MMIWLEIGASFEHKDRKGLTVAPQAHPLDGRIVLREVGSSTREKPDRIQETKTGGTRENPLPANKDANPAQDAGSRPQIIRDQRERSKPPRQFPAAFFRTFRLAVRRLVPGRR
jgi:hypothetical protein